MVGDPQKQFRLLQKEAQRTFIAMADLLKQGETTYQLIKSQVSYPGGREEKHQSQHSQQACNEDDPPPSKRAKFSSLVTTSTSFESVPKESFSVLKTSSRND